MPSHYHSLLDRVEARKREELSAARADFARMQAVSSAYDVKINRLVAEYGRFSEMMSISDDQLRIQGANERASQNSTNFAGGRSLKSKVLAKALTEDEYKMATAPEAKRGYRLRAKRTGTSSETPVIALHPNRLLANDYFRASTPYCAESAFASYVDQRDRILKANIDIEAFYREHGSLDRLCIKGLDLKAKETLETILHDGVEAAINQTRDERLHKMQKRRIRIPDTVQEIMGGRRRSNHIDE